MNTRSKEVAGILRRLGNLPGGNEMDVVARRYPRQEPGFGWTGFEQVRWTIKREIPADFGLPIDVEEIIITLRGTLTDTGADLEVRQALERVLNELEIGREWEARARFADRPAETNGYEVTLFNNPFHGSTC